MDAPLEGKGHAAGYESVEKRLFIMLAIRTWYHCMRILLVQKQLLLWDNEGDGTACHTIAIAAAS